jgi:hypothetical protein
MSQVYLQRFSILIIITLIRVVHYNLQLYTGYMFTNVLLYLIHGIIIAGYRYPYLLNYSTKHTT